MRFTKMTLAAAVGALALALGAACGDGGDEVPQSSPTPEPSPVSARGSVAPGTSMTFEGKRYQARHVAPDLVSAEDLELAGTTAEIDIDHAGPVKVYRLMDDSSNSLFTFQPGRATAGDEEGPMPDVWLEWIPEAEGPADGSPPEADVATAAPVPTPYVQQTPMALPPGELRDGSEPPPGATPPVRHGPPVEAPLGEFEDDPSFLPGTTPPPAQEDPTVQ